MAWKEGIFMAQEKGRRVILLEFTGTELTNNRIFGTTSEEQARKNGLYSGNAAFGPVPTVVGHGDVLPALDEQLAQMKEGETRTIRLAPEKAFGQRRPDLIVVVPLKAFHERKINPTPGLIVDLNGGAGRVQTVSGGRVRVDLNSDLAGKEVEYTIKVAKELESGQEKCQALTQKFFPLQEKAQARLTGGILKVVLPREIARDVAPLVPAFTKTIKEVIPEITSVEIVESFESGPGKEEQKKLVGAKEPVQDNKAQGQKAGQEKGQPQKNFLSQPKDAPAPEHRGLNPAGSHKLPSTATALPNGKSRQCSAGKTVEMTPRKTPP